MKKQIRLNAFAMNCVAHQSPGLWTHPRDRTLDYNRLPYWLDLAKTLERGRFDGLFLADVLGVYDVFGNSPDAALRNAAQTPANEPLMLRDVYGLSYDEIARTAIAAGSKNTLPLEIWAMTTNVTSPTLYAVGAVTTVVSFVVIVAALGSIALVQRRRAAGAARATATE